MSPMTPDRVRQLAHALVACPSVTGQPTGENDCADLMEAALPAGLERGRFWTDDHRAVLWAHCPGRSPQVTLLLGHHDTVAVQEYAALGAPSGRRIAFDPPAVLEALRSRPADGLDRRLRDDLAEERRTPGTWDFGRGMLDMKSGLAAGIAALGALHRQDPPECGVLFASCPDEEVGSAGVLALASALPRWLESRRARVAGVLNLDFSEGPWAHAGALGKLRVLLWVRGTPTHVGSPFAGWDAAQTAAALARALTTDSSLADPDAGDPGTPAVLLRLRDLKPHYDVQTAVEAVVELNLLTRRRGPESALRAVGAAAEAAVRDLALAMRGLAGTRPSPAWAEPPRVWTLPELHQGAGSERHTPGPGDASAQAVEEVRRLAATVAPTGPLVVLALLPPFYPHAAGEGAFLDAARRVLDSEGVETRGAYPFITDASLLAGAPGQVEAAARWVPAILRGGLPPAPSGTEMLNLGPWGRDAHGLGERVHQPWAFARLPALVSRVLREIPGG